MGPGRGYLMQDILQTFRNFKIDNHFDLSFVEGKNLMTQFLNSTKRSSKKTSWKSLRKVECTSNMNIKMKI